MKFIIFFICVPFVSSGTHTFITTYTGIRGQTTAGIPEFVAVSSLDGHQIDYYDSNTMELIPKQDWMKEFVSTDMWKEDTDIRKHVQQIYKNNIHDLMERFNQTEGVHTFQRRYGCDYDNETGESQGFDEYTYDGEDFISLDLKEFIYISPVQQSMLTLWKWNTDREQIKLLKQYYNHECVHWLKYFLALRKEDLKIIAPEVSLLQTDLFSPVTCSATGFYPSSVSITWTRNGQDHNEDVDLGEILPNEDGTFQKSATLYVAPAEWKKNQYVCVVEHQGKTIRKMLTEVEINSNYRHTEAYITIHVVLTAAVMLMLIFLVICAVVVYMKRKKMHGFMLVSSGSEEVILIDKGL